MFPIVGFLVRKILRIVGFQIWIEKLFSIVGIFANLKRCHLQLHNLEKWIFVNTNWPNDAKVGCKAFNNVVDFIDSELNLELELDEFECSF